MTTTALAKKDKLTSVREMLERSKPQIALALPKHLNPERMLRIAMTSVQRTPKLLECDPRSLIGAVIQAAQLGLEPDGVLGHAYLIPYKDQVQFVPGYRGLIELARRSGKVRSIQARCVYQGDEFSFAYGDAPFVNHTPSPTPGALVAVYGVAMLDTGEKVIEVMWRQQVDAIRKRSRAADAGPWVTDYDEMARKTVARRLCKWLPMSVELARAVELSDAADVGLPQNLPEPAVDVTTGEVVAMPAPKSTLDQIADGLPQAQMREPGEDVE